MVLGIEKQVGQEFGQTGLSVREKQVLQLMAQGFSKQEVAKELGIKPRTVETESKSMYGKLGVGSIRAAVVKGVTTGIIDTSKIVTEDYLERIVALSKTEKRVLAAIADGGKSNREAGLALSITGNAVAVHINEILSKLRGEDNDMSNVLKAIVIFLEAKRQGRI